LELYEFLNDDTVAAGMGFGEHECDNINHYHSVEGDLALQDSMGNVFIKLVTYKL
jgi:hypothetical protein